METFTDPVGLETDARVPPDVEDVVRTVVEPADTEVPLWVETLTPIPDAEAPVVAKAATSAADNEAVTSFACMTLSLPLLRRGVIHLDADAIASTVPRDQPRRRP